jgi:hypothetical protein
LISSADFFKMMVASLSGSTASTTVMSAYRIRGIRLSIEGDGAGTSVVIFKWGDDRGPDRNFVLTCPATGQKSMSVPINPHSFNDLWLDIANASSSTLIDLDYSDLNGTFYLDITLDFLISPGYGTAGPTVGSSDVGLLYPNLPAAGNLELFGFS